jgi:hypothetical protein
VLAGGILRADGTGVAGIKAERRSDEGPLFLLSTIDLLHEISSQRSIELARSL